MAKLDTKLFFPHINLINNFEKIQKVLPLVQKPSRYIGGEYNSPNIDVDAAQFNFCMIYPDLYEIGQSNQAVRIICNCVNDMPGYAAQRSFLPDINSIKIFKDKDISMFSLETFSPLKDFDAVGIVLSHELCATNVLLTLDFSGIPLRSDKRSKEDPFVIGGGPVCCNPEPLSAFFDAMVIGEGEELLPNCLKKINTFKSKGAPREQILLELSKIPGLYVPSLYSFDKSKGYCSPNNNVSQPTVNRQIYTKFSNNKDSQTCIVPFMNIAHDRLNVEILRGCARGCRFCQAGIMYRPVREKSKETIIKQVDDGVKQTGYSEVSLTSLSSTDHSQIVDVLDELNNKYKNTGMRISLPSQRLDSFGIDMAKAVAGTKKGGLTFAPEAGTQRLRDAINKNVTEQNLFDAAKNAFSNGWNRCKLYFMIGLPTETDNDLIGIANLCDKVYEIAKDSVPDNRKKSVFINVSIAVFVPKSQTPFMWDGAIDVQEALRRINLIRKNIKSRFIKVSWHEPKSSYIEAVLSRGGRQCCNLIETAYKNGAVFDSWNDNFDYDLWVNAAKTCCVDIKDIAEKDLEWGTPMPWDHISFGINKDFFLRERKAASKAKTTEDCTFGKCSNCGVCTSFNVSNEIVETRNQI